MATYHNLLLCGFVASDSSVIVYLKQDEESREYAVKVKHRDGTRTVVRATYSLSSAMHELAQTIAQFTGGFTSWRKL